MLKFMPIPADGSWSRYAVASLDDERTRMRRPGSLTLRREPRSSCPTRPLTIPNTASTRCCSTRRCSSWLPPSRRRTDGSTDIQYLPVSVATIRVFGPIGRRARCHTDLAEHEAGGYHGRIVLRDDTGMLRPRSSRESSCGRSIRGLMPLPLEQKIFDTDWVASSVPEPIGRLCAVRKLAAVGRPGPDSQ